MKRTKLLLFAMSVILLLALVACEMPAPGSQAPPATATSAVPPLGVTSLPPVLARPTPTPDGAAPPAEPTPPPAVDPAAPPPAQETSPTGEVIHTVQAGENLFRIGLRYGFTAAELAAYNGIPNPNVISVGQQIRIPPRP